MPHIGICEYTFHRRVTERFNVNSVPFAHLPAHLLHTTAEVMNNALAALNNPPPDRARFLELRYQEHRHKEVAKCFEGVRA